MKLSKKIKQVTISLTTLIITIIHCLYNIAIGTETKTATQTNITQTTTSQEQPEGSGTFIERQATIDMQKLKKNKSQTFMQCSQSSVSADGNIKNIDDTAIQQEKRRFVRFNIKNISHPIIFKTVANNPLIDISRGGIAIEHNNTMHTGDIFPVHIIYKNIVIDTNAKVVSTTENRAGAEFIATEEDVINQLLYLSVLLESDNNMLGRRINQ